MDALIRLAEAWWPLYAVHFVEVSLFILAGLGSGSLDDVGYAIAICPLFVGAGEGVCAAFLRHFAARVFDGIRRCADWTGLCRCGFWR